MSDFIGTKNIAGHRTIISRTTCDVPGCPTKHEGFMHGRQWVSTSEPIDSGLPDYRMVGGADICHLHRLEVIARIDGVPVTMTDREFLLPFSDREIQRQRIRAEMIEKGRDPDDMDGRTFAEVALFGRTERPARAVWSVADFEAAVMPSGLSRPGSADKPDDKTAPPKVSPPRRRR